jgi:hypothetical protein
MNDLRDKIEAKQGILIDAWIEAWGDLPEEGDECLAWNSDKQKDEKVIVSRQDENEITDFWIFRPGSGVEENIDLLFLRPMPNL